MTNRDILNARIKVAQEFSKVFNNPLFHKEFLLLTENDKKREYNTVIVAASEEKIAPTIERFLKTDEVQASIVSIVDGEVLLRVISPAPDDDTAEVLISIQIQQFIHGSTMKISIRKVFIPSMAIRLK